MGVQSDNDRLRHRRRRRSCLRCLGERIGTSHARRRRVLQRTLQRCQRIEHRGVLRSVFGFIFTVTQYLQFVKGYNTLETGVRTLPFAVATGFAAPIAVKMVRKIGTKYVVAAGLATMAVGFLVTSTFSATTTYTTIAASMVLLGGGLGLIMAPATESIMGSLPTEKAGVGSAVNDTTRQLGGTLGVAVIGSLFASAYGDKLTAGLRGLLPERAVTAARSSIRAAYAVADAAPASARPMIRTRGYRAVFRATVPTGGLSSTSSPGTRTPASSSSSRSHRCSTRYSPRCGGRRSAGTATIQSVPSRRSSTATNEPSSTSPSQPQRDVVDAARPAPLTASPWRDPARSTTLRQTCGRSPWPSAAPTS